jgi:hypothetical protein
VQAACAVGAAREDVVGVPDLVSRAALADAHLERDGIIYEQCGLAAGGLALLLNREVPMAKEMKAAAIGVPITRSQCLSIVYRRAL